MSDFAIVDRESGDTGCLAWAVAGRALADPLEGAASGDHHVVVDFGRGTMLAAIDGLGHGNEAAHAAREAGRIASEHADAPVEQVLAHCHRGLRDTRGVVMTIASVGHRDGSLTWAGVGNVEALHMRGGPEAMPGRNAPMLRGGIVGYQLPSVRVSRLLLAAGDVLVMATDGIASGFGEAVRPWLAPTALVADLFARFARGTDDALMLAARYRGVAR